MTSEEAFKGWYQNHRRDRYKTIEELSRHAWEAALEWKGKEAANCWEVRLNDVNPDTECEGGYTTTRSDTTEEKAVEEAIEEFLDHHEWGRGYSVGDTIRIMSVTDGLGNTTQVEVLVELQPHHWPMKPVLPGTGGSGN